MPVIATKGSWVRVSRFKIYDISQDRFVESTRYATQDTIAKLNGQPVGPFVEIPAADLNVDGMTDTNYTPV